MPRNARRRLIVLITTVAALAAILVWRMSEVAAWRCYATSRETRDVTRALDAVLDTLRRQG